MMVVLSLSMVMRLACAEHIDGGLLEFEADLFGDHLAAGQDGDVFQHGLAAVAEAGSLDGADVQHAAQLVDHQGGQRFAFDVFGDDQQRTAGLGGLLQNREEVLHVGDLLVVDQDHGVFKGSFHPLRIGDEVGGEVAAVELHPFDGLQGGFHRLGFLDGDDPFLADFFHGLGDDVADGLVVVGGDGADLGDFLVVLDRLGDLLQFGDDGFNSLVDAALDFHRVVTGGNQLGTLL